MDGLNKFNIMANILKETINRASSETTDYHKKVRNFGLGLFALGLIAKTALAIFPATMPIGIAALAGDFITIGLTAAGIAQTTKK